MYFHLDLLSKGEHLSSHKNLLIKIHCLSKVITRKMLHLAKKWLLTSLMLLLSFLAIFFFFFCSQDWVGSHPQWMDAFRIALIQICLLNAFYKISHCWSSESNWIMWWWMRLRWETKRTTATRNSQKGNFCCVGWLLHWGVRGVLDGQRLGEGERMGRNWVITK